MRYLCLCLLVFLVACGGGPVEYGLTSVLPATVTPGESVTIYGTLPQTGQLYLGEELIQATPKHEGWQFTVPEATSANTYVLTIKLPGQSLTGALQVIPRVDTLNLVDKTLRVQGAGWSSDPKDTVVLEFAGMTLTPQKTTGTLSAELPKAVAYGRFTARLTVNGQTSKAIAVSREAGAVTGKVAFSATAPAPLLAQQLNLLVETPSANNLKDLVVFHTSTLSFENLEGLAEQKTLAQLQATRLSFTTPQQAKEAKAVLTKAVGVQKVEWDQPVATDSFTSLAIETQTVSSSDQWFLELSGIRSAWDVTKGAGVNVAVLDTGVNLQHPDLKPNLLPGYDFIDSDTSPDDLAGHGTHVAGLVAANGQLSGVAPEAKILPVRVLEGTSGGSAFTVAEGILWAANLLPDLPNPNPADVMNLSLGSNSYSEVIASAIAQVQAEGVVVVAASGNSSGPVAYPAALPGVIAVTSLAGPKIAYQPWYTNKGAGLWVTAYGGDTTQDQDGNKTPDGILSTDLMGYGMRMGTSMASPQVAGLIALMLASGTPKAYVKNTLANTTTELGLLGYDNDFGYGLATGRALTTSQPKSYVLAFDGATLVSWSLVQKDNSFGLSNLPPNRNLQLKVASDEDGDFRLAEAGEQLSSTTPVNLNAGQSLSLETLTLNPTDGTQTVFLEAR